MFESEDIFGTFSCPAGFQPAGFECEEIPPTPPVWQNAAAHLPTSGEWALIPGSEIGAVLVQPTEYPWCAETECVASFRSFTSWTGVAFDEANGLWINPAGGGHNNYGGSETYVYSFATNTWSRDDQPPLDGPFLRDTDGDGTPDACPSPTGIPSASHSYDGVTYIPSNDEVLYIAIGGYCKTGPTPMHPPVTIYAYTLDHNTSTWTSLYPVHPQHDTDRLFAYPKSAYDAGRDLVYVLGTRFGSSNNGWLYVFDPSNDYGLVSEQGVGFLSMGVATFDESRDRLYWTTFRNGIYEWDPTTTAFDRRVVWTAATQTARLPIVVGGDGLVYTWDGGREVYRYDPDNAWTMEDVTPAGGPQPFETSPGYPYEKAFSRWEYVAAIDAFIAFNDPRLGIWLWRAP